MILSLNRNNANSSSIRNRVRDTIKAKAKLNKGCLTTTSFFQWSKSRGGVLCITKAPSPTLFTLRRFKTSKVSCMSWMNSQKLHNNQLKVLKGGMTR